MSANSESHIVSELGENALIVGGDQWTRRVARVTRARRRRAAQRRHQVLCEYACLDAFITDKTY